MTVSINNKFETLPEAATLNELLERVSLAGKQGIAVAVNNNIISQASWNNFKLSESDKITIIHATQGG